MKTKNNILTLFFIYIITVLISFSSSSVARNNLLENDKSYLDSSKVQLTIEPEFENYLLDQKVWIKLKILNNTDSNYYMEHPVHVLGGLGVKIIDPNGNQIPRPGFGHYFIKIDTLKPKQKYQIIMPLDSYMYYHQDKMGEYKITCYYQGLESNTLNLDFVKPNEVNKELYELILKMKLTSIKNEERIKILRLMNQYDESEYTPQLYYRLLPFSVILEYKEELETIFDNYFKTYLDLFETKYILYKYGLYLKYIKKVSDKEMDKIINELANRNKTKKSKIIFDSFLKTQYKEIKEKYERDSFQYFIFF